MSAGVKDRWMGERKDDADVLTEDLESCLGTNLIADISLRSTGKDDMPAHVKSALIGASVTIPIRDGKLMTGTWQGIWHLEFRRAKHTRNVVATIQGEKR